jgi:hypothetical protein
VHRNHLRACFVALVMLASIPSAAFGASAHNYVNMDLAWDPPPPGRTVYNTVLIDADSAKKSGDTVEFDELVLSPLYQRGPSQPPASPLRTTLMHEQLSCGWRTFHSSHHDAFIPHGSSYGPIADKLCAGVPLTTTQGAKTVEAAIAFWKDYLPQPTYAGGSTNTITVQRVIAPTAQTATPWLQVSHAFVPTPVQSGAGNALFLDRALRGRDGDAVTAFSLIVLGPDTTRSSSAYGGVLMLRKARYDCARGTMVVLSQATWNRYDELVENNEEASAERVAGESPVTAADIRAACADGETSSPSYATIEDAWAFARTHWPPVVQPAWIACAWSHYPDAMRSQYVSDWQNYATTSQANPNARAPSLPEPSFDIARACDVPHGSSSYFAVNAYAMQRGTLEFLFKRHIEEVQIKAAWDATPWLLQQRYIRSVTFARANDPNLTAGVLNPATRALGIDDVDTATRQQVEDYLVGEAKLERTPP